MKPKRHKTVRYSRPKRQNQIQRRHHHCQASIDPYGNEKYDVEENDADPLLSETFKKKTHTWQDLATSPSPVKKTNDNGNDEYHPDNEFRNTIRQRREQLIERLRVYNNLFKFHKIIKEDQVYLYRKLQDMDELYLRNTAAILRLGFCPCLVHQQTSSIGDILVRIHRRLRVWDKKVDNICEILKEPSTRKTTAAVLKILKGHEWTENDQDQTDFHDIALPDIVWDLEDTLLEELNTSKLADDWRIVSKDVKENLCKAEMAFQQVCLEFGITRGPEQLPPDIEYTARSFITYENMIARDESSNNEQQSGDETEEVSSIDDTDTPSSRVSSSFF